MSIYLDQYKMALKKSFDFDGKMNNSEFWKFMVVHSLIMLGTAFLDNFFGDAPLAPGTWVGSLTTIYLLLTLPANLTSIARRLRDAAYNPCCMFLIFIPLAQLILMVMLMRRSR